MKRALRSKVKANLENNPSEDATVDSLNLPLQKINRRTRTSAAMIGLAISMGASSLFVTRQSDQALAAEPVGNQNTASAIPAAGDTGVKLATTQKMGSQAVSNVSAPENPVPVVEPTAISQVPGLGAKWQTVASRSEQVSASFTQTAAQTPNSVADLNTANKGQKIQSAIARVQARLQAPAPVPTSYGITNSSVAQLTTSPQTVSSLNTSEDANAQLKAQQEFAINRLQQKSDRLRDSLSKLRSVENNKSLPQANATVEVTQQSQYATTNNLDSSTVKNPTVAEMPNRVGIVPGASKVYEVKPGDTLFEIASSNGTSVSEIVNANGLQNANELKISQKLNIPVTNAPINATQVAKTNQVSVASNVAIPTPAQLGAVASNNTTIAPVVVPTPVATIQASVPSDSTPVDPQANGIGGETPPKVFAEMQQRNARNKQEKQDRGLRSLQAEIERLREKYRAQQSGNQVPTQANLNNVSVPVPTYTPDVVTVPRVPTTRTNNIAIPVPTVRPNTVAIPIPVPTLRVPNYSAQPLNPEWSARNARNNNQLSVPPVPTTVNASESLGNMRGVTVSPQLPPLAAVDRYLPRPIDENTPAPVAPGGAPGVGNTAFIWPAKGVLTSGYGWRWGRMHRGIDVANSVGTPIYAAAAGVIEKSGWNNGGYGNVVDVRHADGSMTRYGHNSKLMVQAGQQVKQGDIIALMGSTGFSTGPHSHFEIHIAGKGAVNPIAMLPPRV
ncbi:peptidase M23B [Calothrix sp. NIES-4071]|nr:peptidase M23B [Calothrix sp. NIES-4071]BAZ58506.1 peptidase M23B [Calothrix sp. NIES-4105]